MRLYSIGLARTRRAEQVIHSDLRSVCVVTCRGQYERPERLPATDVHVRPLSAEAPLEGLG
jgi:hypothetical protein